MASSATLHKTRKAPEGPSLLPFNIPILTGVSKNVDLGLKVIIS